MLSGSVCLAPSHRHPKGGFSPLRKVVRYICVSHMGPAKLDEVELHALVLYIIKLSRWSLTSTPRNVGGLRAGAPVSRVRVWASKMAAIEMSYVQMQDATNNI